MLLAGPGARRLPREHGGGAYAVGKKDLGATVSLLAAASLVVDYVLTVAVSLAAGAARLASAFPSLRHDMLAMCLAGLVLITAVNLWGIAESARVLMLPMVVFLAAIFGVIAVGLVRSHPAAVVGSAQPVRISEALGAILILKALRAAAQPSPASKPSPTTSPPSARRARLTRSRLAANERGPECNETCRVEVLLLAGEEVRAALKDYGDQLKAFWKAVGSGTEGQVPPLHLPMPEPGIAWVNQVEVGALPVPHLPARVPRVSEDRRHRPQRPRCPGPVRIPLRAGGGKAWDPGVVQRPGDPRGAVPGQPLREHPRHDRRGGRVGFEAVGPPAPRRMCLVRMRPGVGQPVPVRRAPA